MNTFLPYPSFIKSAKCLDNKRLGKQRVEVWQIYNALKQGEYKNCPECEGVDCIYFSDDNFPHLCNKCKGSGKIKTPWYNHPCTQMWKGYEGSLLKYGMEICLEWTYRGYKDNLYLKFLSESYCNNFQSKRPSFIGNKKFHRAYKSNLLRKDKKFYSQYNWNVPNDLPYIWG